MGIRAYTNWTSRKEEPGFRPDFVPDPADTVEIPEILVSEGEDAEDSIIRHLLSEQEKAS